MIKTLEGTKSSFCKDSNGIPVKYRPVDGTCNLLSAPHLGASFTPFQRIIDARYGYDKDADGRR